MRSPALFVTLLLAASNATADGTVTAKVFGDWLVDFTNDRKMIYAASINDSGSIFVENCNLSGETCKWMIVTDAACEEGKQYPVLANSDASAAHLTILCEGKTNSDDKASYGYAFTDWKALEQVILNAKRVGFALPMQSDRFTVVRFSLDGVKQAAELAEAVAFEMRKKSKSDTSNVRL